MADFLGPYGIRVNSVSPAVVASALMGDRLVSPTITFELVYIMMYIANQPQPYFNAELEAAAVFPRRTSEAAEVASGIVFLLENSMMNDFELRIDGGWRGCSNWAGPKDPRANAPALE